MKALLALGFALASEALSRSVTWGRGLVGDARAVVVISRARCRHAGGTSPCPPLCRDLFGGAS
jgi:hypothetical protein